MKAVRESTALAHPSLALIKYWGKQDTQLNLPATPSLAVTLGDLNTRTTVTLYETSSPGDALDDSVYIDGKLQPKTHFARFFQGFRSFGNRKFPQQFSNSMVFEARSSSDFPASAGLASSASGFAALVLAAADAAALDFSREDLSAIARLGSASAARSIWGGFTSLDAGAHYAESVHDENWWPELRTVVLEIESGPKSISSRMAMEATRTGSPYYPSWISDAPKLFRAAKNALKNRNLDELGPLIRESYMRMFASMFASSPPIVYWKPGSIAAIHFCEALRREGLSVWETMDAGPQIKIFCLEQSLPDLLSALKTELPDIPRRVSGVGGAPLIIGRKNHD